MLNAEEVYELIGLNEIERKIYETIVGLGAKTLEELVLYLRPMNHRFHALLTSSHMNF